MAHRLGSNLGNSLLLVYGLRKKLRKSNYQSATGPEIVSDFTVSPVVSELNMVV